MKSLGLLDLEFVAQIVSGRNKKKKRNRQTANHDGDLFLTPGKTNMLRVYVYVSFYEPRLIDWLTGHSSQRWALFNTLGTLH